MRRVRLAVLLAVGGAIGMLPGSAAAATFSNSAAIAINDFPVPMSCSTGADGATASPYPSAIQVSGLPGQTTRVTATLHGLTHTFPTDIRMLLVGPQGQSTELFHETGGNADATDLTITFDDAAATSVPDPLVSGTFKPSQEEGCLPLNAVYPGPAPAPPYPTTLASFNGTNPNGAWGLYVVDDSSQDSGFISGGWSLDVSAVPPPECAAVHKKLKKLKHKRHHASAKKRAKINKQIAKAKKRLQLLAC